MKQAVVLATVLALTVLGGCLENGAGDDVPLFGSVAPEALEAGTYQFTHRGGSLQLSVDSDHYALFDLFNGEDSRIGRIELGKGGFADQLTIDGAAGEYVISILELAVVPEMHEEMADDEAPADDEPHTDEMDHAELRIESGGRSVQNFMPLGLHVERHLLVDREFENMGQMVQFPESFVGQGRGEPLRLDTTLELDRTPVDIQILVAGYAMDLQIRGRGAGGIILEAQDSYDTPWAHLEPLPREFHHENVQDNILDLTIDSPQQEGPIILEASSFSRYVPADIIDARVLSVDHPGDGVVFTYGDLPPMPTRITISGSASVLQAWTEDMVPEEGTEEGCEQGEACSGSLEDMEPIVAWFAVYDPSDVKLGTFRVESGQRLEIPITQGGGYVVHSIRGPVTIGTNAAPSDFEMHPLETEVRMIGSDAPGSNTRYGTDAGSINVTGVPYLIEPGFTRPTENNGPMQPLFFEDCSSEGSVRLLAGGETLGVAGERLPNSFRDANLRLPASGLAYIQDGFSGNCGQLVLAVHVYYR